MVPTVRAGVVAVLALMLTLGSAAGSPSDGGDPAPPAEPAQATVAAVVSGHTFRLERPVSGSDTVRLAGVWVPAPAEPLAGEAGNALADLVQGRRISLAFGAARHDRHRRLLADAVREDGLWIQGQLLRTGWARVDVSTAPKTRLAAMLAREDAARASGLGLWGHPAYAVRSPETVGRDLYSLQIVEGRVIDVAEVRGRVFLNFGPDYRTDFTITIAPDDRNRFKADGFDPSSLAGQRVRVRGWVQPFNGPQIEVTHPAQIEPLGR